MRSTSRLTGAPPCARTVSTARELNKPYAVINGEALPVHSGGRMNQIIGELKRQAAGNEAVDPARRVLQQTARRRGPVSHSDVISGNLS